jgi:hypothetical protein
VRQYSLCLSAAVWIQERTEGVPEVLERSRTTLVPWVRAVPNRSKRINHVRGIKRCAVVELHARAQGAGPGEQICRGFARRGE